MNLDVINGWVILIIIFFILLAIFLYVVAGQFLKIIKAEINKYLVASKIEILNSAFNKLEPGVEKIRGRVKKLETELSEIQHYTPVKGKDQEVTTRLQGEIDQIKEQLSSLRVSKEPDSVVRPPTEPPGGESPQNETEVVVRQTTQMDEKQDQGADQKDYYKKIMEDFLRSKGKAGETLLPQLNEALASNDNERKCNFINKLFSIMTFTEQQDEKDFMIKFCDQLFNLEIDYPKPGVSPGSSDVKKISLDSLNSESPLWKRAEDCREYLSKKNLPFKNYTLLVKEPSICDKDQSGPELSWIQQGEVVVG